MLSVEPLTLFTHPTEVSVMSIATLISLQGQAWARSPDGQYRRTFLLEGVTYHADILQQLLEDEEIDIE